MPNTGGAAAAAASVEGADEKSLLKNILSIVTAHNLHTSCIPSLRSMRASITAAASSSSSSASGGKRPVLSLSDIAARKSNKGKGLKMVTSLLSKVLFSYGEHCHTQGLYDEAIAAFLSCAEPAAPRNAVHSAIVNGNWHDAIAIGGRYYVEGDDERCDDFEDDMDPYGSNKVTSLNPRRIAQGIIEDYKSMLEQGLGGIESNEYISIFCSNTQKKPSSAESDISPPEESGETQAISIATLCLEYFNDIEGAVAILLLAKAWRAAAQMASRHGRSDLLTEDVGGALRFEAKAMIRLLPERTSKQTEVVAKLNELWSDPAARLEAVSGVDAGRCVQRLCFYLVDGVVLCNYYVVDSIINSWCEFNLRPIGCNAWRRGSCRGNKKRVRRRHERVQQPISRLEPVSSLQRVERIQHPVHALGQLDVPSQCHVAVLRSRLLQQQEAL
jgi:hypothetical protein